MDSLVMDDSLRSTGMKSVEAARRLETAVKAFAIVVAVVITLVSLGYTFLAYPQTDDLERTGALRYFTPLQRIISDCRGIEGRWAADLIQYSAYQGGHIVGRYPVLLTFLILSSVLGCCCAVSLIGGRRMTKRSVIAGGIVAYSFLWLSAPWGEVFYWFPAGVEGSLNIALSMLLLWLLFNFQGRWVHILVVTMSFVLPAIHEVYGIWVVGVLAVIVLVRLAGGKDSGTAGVATMAGVLGLASNLVMPGVRARAASAHHHSLHDALQEALHIQAFNLAHWVALVPVLVVILLAVAHKGVPPSWYDQGHLVVKAWLFVAVVPLPILALTMISYALGGAPSPHVFDDLYLLWAAATAAFVAVCGFDLGRWPAAKRFLTTPSGSFLRSAVMLLAVAGAMSLPRFRAAFHDIDPAIRNRAVWMQRTKEIWAERSAGVLNVVVTQRMLPLTILPTYYDLTEDPHWYANQHLSMYYGLQSIRLSVPPPLLDPEWTETLDRIFNQPPAGVSETSPVSCDFGIDSINGASPARPPAMIVDRLTVTGWTAISAKNGIAPDRIFLTLSSANQKLYVQTRTVPRPDVNKAFGRPEMRDSGFTATIDVSRLTGEYTLGISRVYQSKMDSCSQFQVKFLINE